MTDCYAHTNGKLRFYYYPQTALLVVGKTIKPGVYKFATESEFRKFCENYV